MGEHYVTATSADWQEGWLLLACRCGEVFTGSTKTVLKDWETHQYA